MKLICLLFLAIFLSNYASAATIHGTAYDLSLKKLGNARVEINTTPKQLIVAQNGSYSFNVPDGSYTIKAQLLQKNSLIASVQENITVKEDGSYVLDLILFPDIEEGIEGIDIDLNENIAETRNNGILIGIFILAVFVIVLALFIYFKKTKSKKQQVIIAGPKDEPKIAEKEGDYLNQMTEIIKKEGGRTTQKDIRKQIPLSEAKISLMIAELEHKGVIEKIKKGRGNIIILKKNQ
ncbi:hypothetical protein HYX03_02865 [Candidatus Woesearchaeota archaeon]|nr:hypothetical protein [Candidatus Woesearchaeota archaeon]